MTPTSTASEADVFPPDRRGPELKVVTGERVTPGGDPKSEPKKKRFVFENIADLRSSKTRSISLAAMCPSEAPAFFGESGEASRRLPPSIGLCTLRMGSTTGTARNFPEALRRFDHRARGTVRVREAD